MNARVGRAETAEDNSQCKVHLAVWNGREDSLNVYLAGRFPSERPTHADFFPFGFTDTKRISTRLSRAAAIRKSMFRECPS